GRFIIDDFHRLSESLQAQLADLAKISTEQGREDGNYPKLVLIGINQIGSDLIQLVPDIAKRTGIHRVQPGTQADIQRLIESGCNELNIEIEGGAQIYQESKGDYWLTQQLSQSICTMNDVLETQDARRVLFVALEDIRRRVVEK